MTALRSPLRLVAVDPALAHTGMVVAEVTGYARLAPLRAETVNTDPEAPHADRLLEIAHAIGRVVERERAADPARDPLYAVIEDPEGFTGFATARRRRPRDMHYLGAAFGAALLWLRTMPGSPDVPPVLTVAPVSRWYPRVGGNRYVRKDRVVARARAELGERLGRISEHVCMAWALATWWSTQVAPRVWHEQLEAGRA